MARGRLGILRRRASAEGEAPAPAEPVEGAADSVDDATEAGAGEPEAVAEAAAVFDRESARASDGAAETLAELERHVRGRAAELEESARAGAAAWLRRQVRDLQRAAEARAMEAAESQSGPESEGWSGAKHAREAGAAGEATADEVMGAAAAWLRKQAKALRAEGEARAREELREALAAAEARAREAEGRLGRERPAPEGAPAGPAESPAAPEPPPTPAAAPASASTAPLLAAPGAAGGPRFGRAPAPTGAISLSTVSFDELRSLGMSVTQAKRVLKHRDERGFASVHELGEVPGFPPELLDEIRGRLVP